MKKSKTSKKSKISKQEQNSILSIFIRYILIIFLGLSNLYLIYLIFTPLTVYPVYYLLKLFYTPTLSCTTIFLNNIIIEMIDACIAGSAYYLLLILNLAIPNIKLNKRLKMIFVSFSFLLILNILRIVFLSILAYNGSTYFDLTHKLFWYLLSTVFVVAIWFWEVNYFKVKEIPFYEDLKFFYKHSIFKKRK
jgi:exosortase/archaeosortase family protein